MSFHQGLSEPGIPAMTRSAPLPPLDLSHHFSEATKRRNPSSMKAYYKYFQIPGIGNIAGGLPNARFFPFDTLEAQSAQATRWKPTPNHPEPEWEDFDASPDGATSGNIPSNNPSSSKAPAYTTTTTNSTTTGASNKEAAHLTIPMLSGERDPTQRIDVTTALQYGTAQGYPALLSWVRQFTRRNLHPNVPYAGGPEVILTCGSTDGFAKTVELLVDTWLPSFQGDEEREGILVEKFVYPNILGQTGPKGVVPVKVEMDEGGMLAAGKGGLKDVLENWDVGRRGCKRPRLMYTVTMGHNPTGGVLSVKRRKEIYECCERWDVIIVEDDPYWYLQYPSAEGEERRSRNQPAPSSQGEAGLLGGPEMCATGADNEPKKSSGFEFLDSLVPSYLSIDVSGRVVRLDTFSKTVAPGCRLGWITAQPAFVDRFLRITESSTQQPSGFVQSMVASLVLGTQPAAATAAFNSLAAAEDKIAFEGWDTSGWVRWLAGLRGQYERRMVRMSSILDAGAVMLKQSTPTSLADRDYGVISTTTLLSFRWSRGGMFIWVRVHFESHPLFNAPRPLLYPHQSREGGPSVRRRRVLDGTALNTALMLYLTHKPHLVLISPGMMFSANDQVRQEEGWKYYRMCFAAESEENIDACSHRFVSALHKYWKIRKVEEIEELLKELESSDIDANSQKGVSGITDGMGNLGWIGC
ncbi:hypothetical protein MKZ38_007730 [Zalerion maritima]|uniref:Aminotransferase class I/classII domain-containing protein n=1 Tax=Zalerion maritima TaxID=339359 RepID=A0AAD5RIB6_9PEZI|nr:hypothetical protein MKZ38_007730 [Zalerion maritima]